MPLNARGLTPQIRTPEVGKAGSTTKSAVAEGHITITGMKKQDISALNRDTKNSLNRVKAIFDNRKVKEKQKLIQIMNIVGNQAIHEVSAHYGWKEGSKEKVLLHGALGALTGSMSGKGTWTGALSGSVNEFAVKYIEQAKGIQWVVRHPGVVQGISVALGAAVGKVTGNSGVGAYTAQMGTKWNDELDADELLAEIRNQFIEGESVDMAEAAEQVTDAAQMTVPEEKEEETAEGGGEGEGDSSSQTVFPITPVSDAAIAESPSVNEDDQSSGHTTFSDAPNYNYNRETDQSTTHVEPLREEVISKSKEISVKGTAGWVASNWFESHYPYMTREEAEIAGRSLIKRAGPYVILGNYIYGVQENHERFNSSYDAFKADALDVVPLAGGIITGAVAGSINPMLGLASGIIVGTYSEDYVHKEKDNMEKNERELASKGNKALLSGREIKK